MTGKTDDSVNDSKALVSSKSKFSAEAPVAPDGGWGWIILAASFLSSVIVDGMCFSFGIFYLEFLQTYKENKGKTAWIGSVLNGTYMIMGPVAGALAKRYGCRAVAIGGSIWAAAAFFLSTFSPNVNTLIFTYGILGGMGFGLIYLPSIVIVGYYFDKKRAFATGVATCGSGIGAILFAPMSKYLIDEYAWKGAMWIMAGIVLHGMVSGCVYRPLTFRELEKIRRKWIRKQERGKLAVTSQNTVCNVDVECSSDSEDEVIQNRDSTLAHGDTDSHRSHTAQHTQVPENGHEPLLTDNIHSANQSKLARLFSSVMSVAGNDKLGQSRLISSARSIPGTSAGTVRRRYRTTSVNSDTMYELSHKHIGDSWHSLSSYAHSIDSISSSQDSSSINTHARAGVMGTIKDILLEIQNTMDFAMLRNPVFLIYGISCILSMAGFFIPFTYLPDKALGMGYDKVQASMLLSILGIANTVGRLLAGWLTDRPWVDCLLINNCALVVGGVATILCPFCTNYAMLVVYAVVFGTCIAAFVTLRSIILVDLIGLEKLTSAFGIIVLCQGISSFVGSPIAGSLYDITGTYHMSFYVAGSTITLAGIICFPLRWLARRQAVKKANTITVIPCTNTTKNNNNANNKNPAELQQSLTAV